MTLAAEPSRDRLERGLLLAPVIFVVHFLEESSTFVEWFNGHVSRGITDDLFWTVNLTALVITILLVVGCWLFRSELSTLVIVAWLSFLILANGIFHVVGAVVDRGYVPGLLTAIALYLPYSAWVVRQVIQSQRLAPSVVAVAASLGGLPMAVHGYRILFLGSRLF